MAKGHVKLPLLAAAFAASCALVTDFDGYELGTTGHGGSSCVPPLSSCDGQCVDLAEPTGIALDASHVYIAVFGADLYAVSEDGTSSVPFATMQFVDPALHSVFIGIATDDLHVYWPSDVSGTIVKRAKTPGDAEPVVLASGQFDPFIVAVDTTHAYWLNADGSIWRVAL